MQVKPPILEFDPDRNAIINPHAYGMEKPLPRKGILCFFNDVIHALRRRMRLVRIGQFRSEIGFNPVYSFENEGQTFFLLHPGVGAPLAAGFLEEIIACGARNVMVCGGCGVLVPEIAAGHFMIIESAVRDEGTSYHYLPPAREARPSAKAVNALVRTLSSQKIPFLKVKSWTTDGFFRETKALRKSRVEEGCAIVEMEAAALFAVAQYRRIALGEVVYGGDLVLPEGWDNRGWNKRGHDRENLFWIAVQACGWL